MTTERIIEDKELGNIHIRVNSRARHLTFRTKEGVMYATIPPGTPLAEIRKAIEDLRPRLKEAKLKDTRTLIDFGYKIDTEFFKLTVVSGEQAQARACSELGKMQIVCPPHFDFSNRDLQDWMHHVIKEGLRQNAKVILPSRLYALSMQHKLFYKSVKINSSIGRWGSCSGQGNINLSCYLVLLPKHLIDYVLLHELTHLREMNHGERFWALLNQMTEGKAQALCDELKQYRTSI